MQRLVSPRKIAKVPPAARGRGGVHAGAVAAGPVSPVVAFVRLTDAVCLQFCEQRVSFAEHLANFPKLRGSRGVGRASVSMLSVWEPWGLVFAAVASILPRRDEGLRF